MGNIYGYIRVSSTDQNEDRQLIALHEVGVADKNIYMDKLSGKIVLDGEGFKKNLSIRVGDKAVVLILGDINSYIDHIGPP